MGIMCAWFWSALHSIAEGNGRYDRPKSFICIFVMNKGLMLPCKAVKEATCVSYLFHAAGLTVAFHHLNQPQKQNRAQQQQDPLYALLFYFFHSMCSGFFPHVCLAASI